MKTKESQHKNVRRTKAISTLNVNHLLLRSSGGGVGMSSFLHQEVGNVIAGFPIEQPPPQPSQYEKIKSNVEAGASAVSGIYSAYQGYHALKAKRGQIKEFIRRAQERLGRTIQDPEGDAIDNDLGDMESILGREGNSRIGSLIDHEAGTFREDTQLSNEEFDSMTGELERSAGDADFFRGRGISNNDANALLERAGLSERYPSDIPMSYQGANDFSTLRTVGSDLGTPRTDITEPLFRTPRVSEPDMLPEPPSSQPSFATQRGIGRPIDTQMRGNATRFTDAEPEGQEMTAIGNDVAELPRVPLRAPTTAPSFEPMQEGYGVSMRDITNQTMIRNFEPRTYGEAYDPLGSIRGIKYNINRIYNKPDYLRTTADRMWVQDAEQRLTGPKTNLSELINNRFSNAVDGVNKRIDAIKGRVNNGIRNIQRQIGNDPRFDPEVNLASEGPSELTMDSGSYGSLTHIMNTQGESIQGTTSAIGDTATVGDTGAVSELATGAEAGDVGAVSGASAGLEAGAGAVAGEAVAGEAAAGVAGASILEEVGEGLGLAALVLL